LAFFYVNLPGASDDGVDLLEGLTKPVTKHISAIISRNVDYQFRRFSDEDD
jgi:hypothetical protein